MDITWTGVAMAKIGFKTSTHAFLTINTLGETSKNSSLCHICNGEIQIDNEFGIQLHKSSGDVEITVQLTRLNKQHKLKLGQLI